MEKTEAEFGLPERKVCVEHDIVTVLILENFSF